MAASGQQRRMTIDQLAATAGTTSRNVRAYQERGLLPPPEKIGRTGYYDDVHLQRLQLISRLLDRGFSLASIGELLEAWERGDSLADVLGFEEALRARYTGEEPAEVDPLQLARTFPAADQERVAQQVRAAGVLVDTDDGRLLAPNPRLLELARILREEGVPTEALAGEAEQLHEELSAVAGRFLDLFVTYIWQPFADRGAPASELRTLTRALEHIRPVPAEVAAIMTAQAMEERMEAIAGRLLDETGAAPDPAAAGDP